MSKRKPADRITIDSRWSILRDPCCWILEEARESISRKGERGTTVKATYHATLLQACKAIIDGSAVGDSAVSIIESVEASTASIAAALAGIETVCPRCREYREESARIRERRGGGA